MRAQNFAVSYSLSEFYRISQSHGPTSLKDGILQRLTESCRVLLSITIKKHSDLIKSLRKFWCYINKKVTKLLARNEHLLCPRCQKNPRQKLAIKNGNAHLALLLASRATILLVEYWRVLQCRASAQLSRL